MREALRFDRPKGNEAQCPICWRLFSSDGSCEAHKPYRSPKTAACKEPSELGYQAVERRGVAVWVRVPGSVTSKQAFEHRSFGGGVNQPHTDPLGTAETSDVASMLRTRVRRAEACLRTWIIVENSDLLVLLDALDIDGSGEAT